MRKHPATPILNGFDWKRYWWAEQPFNSNPEILPFVKNLLDKFKIDTCVETGTFIGTTTLWFAKHLAHVHTIENNQQYYQANLTNRFSGVPNIYSYLGNSPVVLQNQILPKLTNDEQKHVMFYLDAHWSNYWPVNDELLRIAESSVKNNCLIIVDDVQVPNRLDIPFDEYKGQPLNLAFIETNLRKAIPDLQYEYYIPSAKYKTTRAKLIAYPKHWTKSH